MDNIKKCECVVGMLYDWENSGIVTLAELKRHIREESELKQTYENDEMRKGYNHGIKGWELADYCDRRRSTDLIRFNYCPLCGKKIDWKAIKGGANG